VPPNPTPSPVVSIPSKNESDSNQSNIDSIRKKRSQSVPQKIEQKDPNRKDFSSVLSTFQNLIDKSVPQNGEKRNCTIVKTNDNPPGISQRSPSSSLTNRSRERRLKTDKEIEEERLRIKQKTEQLKKRFEVPEENQEEIFAFENPIEEKRKEEERQRQRDEELRRQKEEEERVRKTKEEARRKQEERRKKLDEEKKNEEARKQIDEERKLLEEEKRKTEEAFKNAEDLQKRAIEEREKYDAERKRIEQEEFIKKKKKKKKKTGRNKSY
jgi:hypothetical protein